MREMKSQAAMRDIGRVAAAAVAALSKREPDALNVRNLKVYYKVTRLHKEIDAVKQLCEKVAKFGRDVEKITASLTNTTNIRDEAVMRADT